jgi:hypothetical protein
MIKVRYYMQELENARFAILSSETKLGSRGAPSLSRITRPRSSVSVNHSNRVADRRLGLRSYISQLHDMWRTVIFGVTADAR